MAKLRENLDRIMAGIDRIMAAFDRIMAGIDRIMAGLDRILAHPTFFIQLPNVICAWLYQIHRFAAMVYILAVAAVNGRGRLFFGSAHTIFSGFGGRLCFGVLIVLYFGADRCTLGKVN